MAVRDDNSGAARLWIARLPACRKPIAPRSPARTGDRVPIGPRRTPATPPGPAHADESIPAGSDTEAEDSDADQGDDQSSSDSADGQDPTRTPTRTTPPSRDAPPEPGDPRLRPRPEPFYEPWADPYRAWGVTPSPTSHSGVALEVERHVLGVSRLIDRLQSRFRPVAFFYAVFKKYADDEGGRLAALLAYYTFLSLFPLAIGGFAVLSNVLRNRPDLVLQIVRDLVPAEYQQQIINAYESLPDSGVGLAIALVGLLLAGTAGVFSLYAMINQVFCVPYRFRFGFGPRLPARVPAGAAHGRGSAGGRRRVRGRHQRGPNRVHPARRCVRAHLDRCRVAALHRPERARAPSPVRARGGDRVQRSAVWSSRPCSVSAR